MNNTGIVRTERLEGDAKLSVWFEHNFKVTNDGTPALVWFIDTASGTKFFSCVGKNYAAACIDNSQNKKSTIKGIAHASASLINQLDEKGNRIRKLYAPKGAVKILAPIIEAFLTDEAEQRENRKEAEK